MTLESRSLIPPDTQILNNTIILSGTYAAAIEYRYPGTAGTVIANNLVDGTISAREGASARVIGNVVNATPAMFVSPATGDLHLRATASLAIDRGVAAPGVDTDWDGDMRPAGSAPDVGADEVVAPIRSAFSGVSCKYGDAQTHGPYCSNRPVER